MIKQLTKTISIIICMFMLLFSSSSYADIVTENKEAKAIDSLYGIDEYRGHFGAFRFNQNKFALALFLTIVFIAIIYLLLMRIIKNKKAKIIISIIIFSFSILFIINRIYSAMYIINQVKEENEKWYERYGPTGDFDIAFYNVNFLQYKNKNISYSATKHFIERVNKMNETPYDGDPANTFIINGINNENDLKINKRYSIDDFIFDNHGLVLGCTIKEAEPIN